MNLTEDREKGSLFECVHVKCLSRLLNTLLLWEEVVHQRIRDSSVHFKNSLSIWVDRSIQVIKSESFIKIIWTFESFGTISVSNEGKLRLSVMKDFFFSKRNMSGTRKTMMGEDWICFRPVYYYFAEKRREKMPWNVSNESALVLVQQIHHFPGRYFLYSLMLPEVLTVTWWDAYNGLRYTHQHKQRELCVLLTE
jgi:hypothetical protein